MEDLELTEELTAYLQQKKEEGKPIIAFLAHDNIPEELIVAAGCVPLRMIFAGNDELMNESHDYLPPSTCSFVQSNIGMYSRKPYDFLDLVDYIIVSNHCISDMCASEIISKYFFIPRINFYCPYMQDENGAKYYKLELIEFKNELEKISGEEISKEAISDAIINYNQLRELLQEANTLNVDGSQKLKIFQKAMLMGIEYLPELRARLEELKNQEHKSQNNAKLLLLTGCSIFVGDYILDLIEEGGGNVVLFDTWVGKSYYSQKIPEANLKACEEPLNLFVERYKNNIYGDHCVPNFLENRVEQTLDDISHYEKKLGKKPGVINHIIKFCDHISLFQTDLKAKLQENGIQVLNLERDYSRAMRGQLSTRIEAFLEMM